MQLAILFSPVGQSGSLQAAPIAAGIAIFIVLLTIIIVAMLIFLRYEWQKYNDYILIILINIQTPT